MVVWTYADGNGDEHETRHALGETLALLEDNGVRNEEHVEQSVQNRHVHADQKHDELGEEELEGPDEEDPEALAHGPQVEVLLGDVVRVAQLLAHLLGARGEDGRGVGLGYGEGDEDPDDAGQDELHPIEPAPAEVVGDEATGKGTDCEGRLAWIL